MKNKNFFYLQYDKINWPKQEKTKTNAFVNDYIIDKIIAKKNCSSIKIFDIGFGIGFFIKMFYRKLNHVCKELTIVGCEPSEKNYNFFIKKLFKPRKGVKLKTYNSTFLNTKTDQKFDFITAIYVFPHFIHNELNEMVKKINFMLEQNGQFILVVENESYVKKKLKTLKDLLIENDIIKIGDKKYKEVLHYTDVRGLGVVIGYDREEQLYIDLFKKNGLKLNLKKVLDAHGPICTVFVFQKG